MRRSLIWPAAGLLVAIAITATMDATGYIAFSALPLCPLLALFWYLDRLSRRDAGFVWGRPAHYALALLIPLVVMGAIAAIAAAAGALHPAGADWSRELRNLALVAISTMILAIVTEEGFFRGWLWGSLARRGVAPGWTLVATSIAFMLWHVSAITLPSSFAVPPAQVPVFLANAALLGASWGLLRLLSGSVLVTSVCHGLWNGLAYVLFGFGSHAGALGISNGALYGPEGGLLGLALNLGCVAGLCWLFRERLGRAELEAPRDR